MAVSPLTKPQVRLRMAVKTLGVPSLRAIRLDIRMRVLLAMVVAIPDLRVVNLVAALGLRVALQMMDKIPATDCLGRLRLKVNDGVLSMGVK